MAFKTRHISITCALLSASLAAGSATAQNWEHGYGQGMAVAVVNAGNGTNITVTCPEGVIGDTSPFISYRPGGNAPRSGKAVVAYVIDGSTHAFNGNWNALGAIEVRGRPGASRAQFDDLIRALKRGRSVEAIAGERGPRHSFPLRGSSKALDYVMYYCP